MNIMKHHSTDSLSAVQQSRRTHPWWNYVGEHDWHNESRGGRTKTDEKWLSTAVNTLNGRCRTRIGEIG
jgi:hypothetical protein